VLGLGLGFGLGLLRVRVRVRVWVWVRPVEQSHTVLSSTPRGSGFRFTYERWGTNPPAPVLPFHAIMDSSTTSPNREGQERGEGLG
jgi:hypothetical protein